MNPDVMAVSHFGCDGRFGQILGMSRFGLFWWVVSDVSRLGHVSFRPREGWDFIRRLEPSIYCLPNKNIRHSQINI